MFTEKTELEKEIVIVREFIKKWKRLIELYNEHRLLPVDIPDYDEKEFQEILDWLQKNIAFFDIKELYRYRIRSGKKIKWNPVEIILLNVHSLRQLINFKSDLMTGKSVLNHYLGVLEKQKVAIEEIEETISKDRVIRSLKLLRSKICYRMGKSSNFNVD